MYHQLGSILLIIPEKMVIHVAAKQYYNTFAYNTHNSKDIYNQQ